MAGSGSSTIGGTTPDYATIQLWDDAADATLTGVYEGKCRATTFSENVIIGGSTSTASNYKKLTYDTGAFHAGEFGAGVVVDPANTLVDHAFQLLEDYVRVIGIEVTGWNGGSSEAFRVGDGTNDADNCRIEQCLIHTAGDINADGVHWGTDSAITTYISNNFFGWLGRSAWLLQGTSRQVTVYSYNNTAVYTVMKQQDDGYPAMGSDGSSVSTVGNTYYVKNCYAHKLFGDNTGANSIMGCYNINTNDSWGSGSGYNASSDATASDINATNYQNNAAVGSQFTQALSEITVGENTTDDCSGSWEDTWLDAAATTTPHGTDVTLDIKNASADKNILFRCSLANVPNAVRAKAANIYWRWDTRSINTGIQYEWFKCLRNWVEGEATWNVWSTGNNWTTAGALSDNNDIDNDATYGGLSGENNVRSTGADYQVSGQGDYVRMTGGSLFLEYVQDAIDGSSGAPKGDDWIDIMWDWQAGETDAQGWGSSDGSDGTRPYLEIVYDTAAAPFNFVPSTVGGTGITHVGASNVEITSGTFNATIPSGTQEGDLILAHSGGRADFSYPTLTPPDEYLQDWAYVEGGNTQTGMWWRRAGPNEGGTTESWSTDNTDRVRELVLTVWRGVTKDGDPFDATHVKTSAYDSTPSAPAITTNTNGAVVVYSWGKRMAADTWTEDTGYPTGTTGVMRRFVGTSGIGIAYKAYATAGSQSAIDWAEIDSTETNLQIEVAVALKPDVAGVLDGNATDLSSDTYPISTDITGRTRSAWDIGAWSVAGTDHEAVASVSGALTVSATPQRVIERTASVSLAGTVASPAPYLTIERTASGDLVLTTVGAPRQTVSPSGTAPLAITTTAAPSLTISAVELLSLTLDASAGEAGPVQYLYPDGTITTTNFEDELGGTTNIHASIDEGELGTVDDNDYIVSNSGAGGTYESVLTSSGDPESAEMHILKVRAESDGGANSMDATFSIVEGTTIRASWTVEDIPAGLVTYEFRMTQEQADSITDYTNLRWRIDVNPSVALLTYFPGDPKGTFTRTGDAWEFVP